MLIVLPFKSIEISVLLERRSRSDMSFLTNSAAKVTINLVVKSHHDVKINTTNTELYEYKK